MHARLHLKQSPIDRSEDIDRSQHHPIPTHSACMHACINNKARETGIGQKIDREMEVAGCTAYMAHSEGGIDAASGNIPTASIFHSLSFSLHLLFMFICSYVHVHVHVYCHAHCHAHCHFHLLSSSSYPMQSKSNHLQLVLTGSGVRVCALARCTFDLQIKSNQI